MLLIVIIACELVGIKIKLQMSDAGGANMKATAHVTNNKCNRLPEGIPKEECVKYINPMAIRRYIYTSPCSVHGLKNHRNQLCNRDLYNKGHCISYSVIVNLYHHLKDEFDNSLNVHPLRHIMCKKQLQCR